MTQRASLREIDTTGALAGQVPTVNADGLSMSYQTPAGSSGSSAGWTQILGLPLTSLTNWSAGAGTWTAETDRIRQALNTSATKRLHYNPAVPQANCLIEVGVRIDAASSTVSSRAGVVFGTPATDGAGLGVLSLLATTSTQVTSVDMELEGVTNYGHVAIASPIALGTWITLRIRKAGNNYDAYVNGSLVCSASIPGSAGRQLARFALYSYATDCSFQNLKMWTPTLP